MMMHVMANAWGPSGLIAIPLMTPDTMIHYVIGIFISYIGGYILTYLFLDRQSVQNV